MALQNLYDASVVTLIPRVAVESGNDGVLKAQVTARLALMQAIVEVLAVG
jgi:hypothetical protein